jgi:hypothetical protein
MFLVLCSFVVRALAYVHYFLSYSMGNRLINVNILLYGRLQAKVL